MIEDTRSLDRSATLLLLLGMLFILGPLAVAVITASQSYDDFLREGMTVIPGTHLIENMRFVIGETQLPRQIWNSIVVATLVAVIKCVIAFTTAFGIVYFRARYAKLIFGAVLITNLMPLDLRFITTYQVASDIGAPLQWLLDITGISWMIEMAFGTRPHVSYSLLGTYFGLAAPLLANGTGTFLFRQFFRTLPADLSKAARMDGAGPLRFMLDILLPLSRANFAALFVLMFLGGWTQYLWPLVAAGTPEMQTAVVGLARLSPGDPGQVPNYPAIMAGAILVSIIPLTMIAALQRQIVRGLTLTEK